MRCQGPGVFSATRQWLSFARTNVRIGDPNPAAARCPSGEPPLACLLESSPSAPTDLLPPPAAIRGECRRPRPAQQRTYCLHERRSVSAAWPTGPRAFRRGVGSGSGGAAAGDPEGTAPPAPGRAPQASRRLACSIPITPAHLGGPAARFAVPCGLPLQSEAGCGPLRVSHSQWGSTEACAGSPTTPPPRCCQGSGDEAAHLLRVTTSSSPRQSPRGY